MKGLCFFNMEKNERRYDEGKPNEEFYRGQLNSPVHSFS